MSTNMPEAATGAGSLFGLVQETAFGVTPATPALQRIRTRPITFNPEAENFLRSQEIGNGRMPTAHRRVFESGTIRVPTTLIYGNTDDILAGIVGGSWNANILTMGQTPRSYTGELHRQDAATPYFVKGVGCFFNSFELQAGADGNEPSLLTLNGIVKEISAENATVDAAGGYDSPVANDEILNGQWNFQVDGGDFEIIAMTLNFQDNRNAKRILGSNTPAGFNRGAGGRRLSGTLTGYAENKGHIDRWKQETESSITAVATDTAGNALTISIPRWKAGNVSETGDEGEVRFEMPFEAYDPSGQTLFSLTRASA